MKTKLSLIVLILLLINSIYYPQDSCSSFISFDLGGDLVSRYIWRGVQYGNEPHIQPYGQLNFNFETAGNLSVGVWGSYGLSGEYSENDFFLQYGIPSSAGETGVMVTDYYFPYVGIPISNTQGKGEGAHTLELCFYHKGTENFPVKVMISNLIYNDYPDFKSMYVELGYSFIIGEVGLDVFAGGANGTSVWHSISSGKWEVINVGVTATKEIKINDTFNVPVGVSFVLNPYLKQTYAVFKLSL